MNIKNNLIRVNIVLALLAMLLLAACGGGDSGVAIEDTNGTDAGTDATGLAADNLDQSLTSGDLTINYPSDWFGVVQGSVAAVSNVEAAANDNGNILTGANELPDGALLIVVQTQAQLEASGFVFGDSNTAESVLAAYVEELGASPTVEPYSAVDFPAAMAIFDQAVENRFPAGTVVIAVQYPGIIALYQVLFDGEYIDYESAALAIINGVTLSAANMTEESGEATEEATEAAG